VEICRPLTLTPRAWWRAVSIGLAFRACQPGNGSWTNSPRFELVNGIVALRRAYRATEPAIRVTRRLPALWTEGADAPNATLTRTRPRTVSYRPIEI